jgi:hypothetical protein
MMFQRVPRLRTMKSDRSILAATILRAKATGGTNNADSARHPINPTAKLKTLI